MDSLSQIVLGAAVGELVLGKKLGNRAMVWGAVAGTLPDMDVLGQFFLNELDNLAFHRGISHSLTATVLGSLFFGWATDRLYRSPHHAKIAMAAKAFAAIVLGFVVNFLTQIFSPGGFWPVVLYIPLAAWILWRHGQRRYFSGSWERPATDFKGWVQLFFLGFLTHILLDCFTTYGTQVFAPFSDMRVAWGTISVVDPIYTLPFLICLLVAARFDREDNRRRRWNSAGIALSSLYLALTVANHVWVESTVEQALADQRIDCVSLFITPTIFNNVLWNAVADAGDEFLLAQYSIYDEVAPRFHAVPKGYELLHNLDTDETLAVLRWFSAGYFNAVRCDDGQLQLNDLRFGTFSGKANHPDDYIFRFNLEDRGPDASYGFEQAQGGPPDTKAEDMMMDLIERAQGLPAPTE
ncbi:MAG: hypothetical protein CL828_09970 [Crocinitomicaceae bacterium]|nr:hypothetical protein [Crocinitomicaceae bacterium]